MKNKILEEKQKLAHSEDPEVLFSYFDLIVQYGESEDLDAFFKVNKDKLLSYSADRFIRHHLNYYLYRDDYPKAKQLCEQYLNSDYGDANTYFYLKDLYDEISSHLKKHREYGEEEMINDLQSSDKIANLAAIKYLSSLNARNYLSYIKKFLLDDHSYQIKVLLLIILVEQQVGQKFNVTKGKDKFVFDPLNQKLPFDKNGYVAAVKYLDSLTEDISLINNTKELLSQLETVNYPFSLFDNEFSSEVIAEVLLHYVKSRYYQIPDSIEKIGISDSDYAEIEKLIEKFLEVLNDTD